MTLLWLPALDRNEHDRSNPWTETSDPKGCLHTTEGGSWPVYDGWTIMPHATIMPLPGKGIRGRQHLPFSQGSFALRNLTGGVQTNRDYVFQFELIGTCEKNGDAYKAGAYYWPDADDAVLADLYRKVIKPLSDAYGIPVRSQPWQTYPASYGARSGSNNVRMSGSDFDSWSGWLGHQHVPENVHGDPGMFPWDRMITASQGDDMPTVAEFWEDDRIPVTATSTAATNPKWSPENALGRTVDRAEQTHTVVTTTSAQVAALATQVAALTAAVAAIASNSPDEITAAFETGRQALADQLAALDVHITVGDDGPPAP